MLSPTTCRFFFLGPLVDYSKGEGRERKNTQSDALGGKMNHHEAFQLFFCVCPGKMCSAVTTRRNKGKLRRVNQQVLDLLFFFHKILRRK